MIKRRTRSTIVAAGAALALTAGLTGCSGLFSNTQSDADRDDAGQVTEEANIDIFALKVGDCMPSSRQGGEFDNADVVPCTEPHAEEVYYEFDLAGDEFPDEDTMWEQIEAECLPAFNDFVGIDFSESALEVYPITPTQGTWEELDDRAVLCVVADPADDQLTESLRGAAR